MSYGVAKTIENHWKWHLAWNCCVQGPVLLTWLAHFEIWQESQQHCYKQNAIQNSNQYNVLNSQSNDFKTFKT